MKPRYLLLDEVTSALDPEMTAEVLDHPRRSWRRTAPPWCSSPTRSSSRAQISNRIVFLEKGVLLVDLPTEEFFAPDWRPGTAARRAVPLQDAERLTAMLLIANAEAWPGFPHHRRHAEGSAPISLDGHGGRHRSKVEAETEGAQRRLWRLAQYARRDGVRCAR